MFNHDDQTNNQPSAAPTLGGAPMSGVNDAAAADMPAIAGPAASSGGSVSGSPIVSPSYTAQPSMPPILVTSTAASSGSDDDLIAIKQQALTQLSPLVDKLDQTPEEKFRLTMTMIQASDDHSLIKTAYEAAQKISDEKVRAEALLSIVNEVNYFSQKSGTPKPADDASAL